MLDFGWPELFMVIAVAVFVIGPNEIPKVMQSLGRMVRRLQYIKYAFSQQFEDFMRVSDMDDIRRQVNFEAAPDHMQMDEAGSDEEYLNDLAEAPASTPPPAEQKTEQEKPKSSAAEPSKPAKDQQDLFCEKHKEGMS